MSETNFVGSVTMEERNELLLFHERILGIQELEYTFNSELLSENDKIQLREKMKREMEAAVKGKIRVKNTIGNLKKERTGSLTLKLLISI